MCSLIAIRDAAMNRMDDFWKSLQASGDRAPLCIPEAFLCLALLN